MYFPDISHYHVISDIRAAIAAGLPAAICKATEGTAIIDPSYADAKTLCIGNGVLFGAYHFGRAGSGVDQADYFLKFAQPDDHMLVALDWEASMGVAGAEQFAQRIHDILGRWPVIYTRKSYAEPLIGNKSTILTNCPLWVASYQTSADWPKQWATYAIQQYSNGTDGPTPHGVAGIGAAIDMNRLNPRFGDLATWWASDRVTPPPPLAADQFVAPIGPTGLQANGLWLPQLTAPAGQWYDANPYGNPYTLDEKLSYHTGADLNQPNDADKGQPIRAACNGVIVFADRIVGSSWGNLIIQESVLPDGSKVWFRYAHSDNLQVKEGDLVTVGQHISDVSNAFGLMPYHLHFDVSLSGVLGQGYTGAIDWPGLRLDYLKANYSDPYQRLLSHMGDVPVTNVVPVKWIAAPRVDVYTDPDVLSKPLTTVVPGGASTLDKDTFVTGASGQGFYKVNGGGFVAADCVAFTSTPTVVRYVNVDAGSNLLFRKTGVIDPANVLGKYPRGTKCEVELPPNSNGYDHVVTINGAAVDGYFADSLLSAAVPR